MVTVRNPWQKFLSRFLPAVQGSLTFTLRQRFLNTPRCPLSDHGMPLHKLPYHLPSLRAHMDLYGKPALLAPAIQTAGQSRVSPVLCQSVDGYQGSPVRCRLLAALTVSDPFFWFCPYPRCEPNANRETRRTVIEMIPLVQFHGHGNPCESVSASP